MKIKKIAMAGASFIVVFAGVLFSAPKQIIGYYPSWKYMMSDSSATVDKLPYANVTMIDYAFWYPRPDGTIAGRNPDGDSVNLGTGRGDVPLVRRAHAQNVAVLLSIGGWGDSENFPAVAGDPRLRSVFARSCVNVIRRYGFDGIDIDWEFPGLAEHNGSASDIHNYTLLLQCLKDSLRHLEKETGSRYVLTAALSARQSEIKNYEMNAVAVLLDMLNIMTYDYSGSWSARSGHNSPLYFSSGSDPAANIDSTVRYLTDELHIPPGKINIGIPFYGHTFAGCTGINEVFTGEDTVRFGRSGAFYRDIVKIIDQSNKHWDDQAKVPYLVLTNPDAVVSYDDTESVGYKAEYTCTHGLGGVIIWELTGDMMDNGTTPLLDVIHSRFTSWDTQH